MLYFIHTISNKHRSKSVSCSTWFAEENYVLDSCEISQVQARPQQYLPRLQINIYRSLHGSYVKIMAASKMNAHSRKTSKQKGAIIASSRYNAKTQEIQQHARERRGRRGVIIVLK